MDTNQVMSHFDDRGNAIMVDISGKSSTERMAIAEGTICVSLSVLEAIEHEQVKKGDVLTIAQVAGIMATKHTAELIPLAHTINLTNASIWFEIHKAKKEIQTFCRVKTKGKTGAEMEALTGVSAALLTIYDMCKAIDKRMIVTDIHLIEKSGGKSGSFHF